MPQQKDLYEILGVSRDASQDEIRRAYLKLAHKYHPDKTGGDKASEEKLKEVNAAYEVLKNPDKRTQYDRFGGDAFTGAHAQGSPFGQGFSGAYSGAGFEDPFEDLFDILFGKARGRRTGGRATHRVVPGRDVEARLNITLQEAALGAQKSVRFKRREVCSECKGSGAAAGSAPQTCANCHGAGQVRMAQGFFSVTRTCPRCRGSGVVISDPCRRCGGDGRVNLQRDVMVDVPPGVDTGSRLRLAGEGEPGTGGGPRGDLYILIVVEPSDIFEREGTTIMCEVPINFAQAAMGDTIQVPTLTGQAELKVPAGTQSGNLLRLRGLGMPDVHGYRQGDEIVRIQVETPTKLSRRQKELIEQFQELSEPRNYPLRRRFIDKLKKLRQ